MKELRKSPGASWLAGVAGVSLLLGLATPSQAALPDGLKAYWNFDQSDAREYYGQFDGTPEGTAPVQFVDGKFGKAVKLDGEDQNILITGGEPDDLAFAGGSVSISAWFKVDAFDTSWQALIAKGESTNWRVARRGAEGGMAYAGGLGDTPTGTDVNDGAWHHLVAISDAAGVAYGTALYIDGALDTTMEGAAVLIANGQRVRIGENPDARGREWEGEIDDVAIWDRVLTPTEIGVIWNGGIGAPLTALLTGDDADNDGMPGWWETQYGFNPDDPADAALDCNNNGLTNLEEYLANLDPCDITVPVVISAQTSDTFDTVTLTFSKDLDPATATDMANYSINPALAITGITQAGKVVTLTTDPQTPGGVKYTVTVTGVKDRSQFEVPAGSNTASFFTYMLTKSGVLKFSYWEGIAGTAVTALTADPRYPASPDMVGAVQSFNTRDIFPNDSHNNYGATIEGYLTPEETGEYYFFLRSDDASEFYISSDATEAGLALMAFEIDCCDAFMEPLTDDATTAWAPTLLAGQQYFVRVILKEGGGGDFAQVAWRKTPDDDSVPAASLLPIPGKYLSAAVDLAVPAEGAFLTRTPAPGAANVMPNAGITISHRDGLVEWTDANVTLQLDGQDVAATVSKDANVVTITYQPASLLSASTHTITVGHPDPAGDPTTTEWSFDVIAYKGPILDKVRDLPVFLMGNASQTGDAGGRTGAAGDLAFDAGVSDGSGWVPDISFINANTGDDTLSVAFWQKNRSVGSSSSFWLHSTSSNNGERGFQAHNPWSGTTIYFDTSGCCVLDTQRINLPITDNPPVDYLDATWWQDWHHFAFVKNGSSKEIYIDGMIFHAGLGDPLKTDFTYAVLGGGGGITENRMNGMLDDFAVYDGGLTFEQVTSLAGGAAPESVPGLLMHWDFDEPLAIPAATIGLNFGADEADGTSSGSLAPIDVAGAYPQVNWNNLTGAAGTSAAPIVDETGAATSVMVEWNSPNTWSSTGRGEENNCFAGADRTLLTGYLDTNNDSTTTVKITDIPAGGSYDLYVYGLGGVAGRGGAYRVVDANTGAELRGYRQAQSADCPSFHVQTPANASTADWEIGTFVLFCDMNETDIIVEATTQVDPATSADLGFPGTGNQRASLNAVQLVFPATCQPPICHLTYAFDPPETLCLDWDCAGGILQEAPTVNGPWTDVGSTMKPYCTSTTGGQMYYRVKLMLP